MIFEHDGQTWVPSLGRDLFLVLNFHERDAQLIGFIGIALLKDIGRESKNADR